jgi:hypothetical protein
MRNGEKIAINLHKYRIHSLREWDYRRFMKIDCLVISFFAADYQFSDFSFELKVLWDSFGLKGNWKHYFIWIHFWLHGAKYLVGNCPFVTLHEIEWKDENEVKKLKFVLFFLDSMFFEEMKSLSLNSWNSVASDISMYRFLGNSCWLEGW